MKILKIYDPAISGSTVGSGPDDDTERVQLADFLKNLEPCNVKVERYDHSQEPAEYTKEPVASMLKEKGTDALPVVMVDDEVISTGEYPDLKKLSSLLSSSKISFEMPDCSGCCGCD